MVPKYLSDKIAKPVYYSWVLTSRTWYCIGNYGGETICSYVIIWIHSSDSRGEQCKCKHPLFMIGAIVLEASTGPWSVVSLEPCHRSLGIEVQRLLDWTQHHSRVLSDRLWCRIILRYAPPGGYICSLESPLRRISPLPSSYLNTSNAFVELSVRSTWS